MGESPSPTLFLWVVFERPKQGEGGWREGAHATWRLHQTQGELRCHDLRPWQMFPWEKDGNAAGGMTASWLIVVCDPAGQGGPILFKKEIPAGGVANL